MRHRRFISEVIDFLKSKNHSVVYDWSKLEPLKPYKDNVDKTTLVAKDISLALQDVDVFVLIADEAGTDMFVELGIVIGKWLENQKIRIYIVGKNNDRSLMHFHPAIKRFDKLSEVFAIELPGFLEEFGGDVNILTN